jgi:predicted HTH domain antitoxin
MKNGRYMIVWGNQRCNAVACRIKRHELPADLEMEVYLFGSEDEMALDLLTRFGNRANGEPVSRQAAIEHAVYAHQQWQVSIEDAAKLAGVSSNAISERLRARETEKRLVETGKRPDLIPMTTQAAMATILNHESAFDKVAELVIRHRPSSARVERLVAKIKKSNAAGRVVAIKDFETECRTELKPAVRSNGQISRPQSVRCFQHFRSLVTFLETGKHGEAFQKLAEMQIVLGSDNETELRKLAKRLKFRLKVLGL